ncbi:MAG TPA: hypothetical protein VFM69_06865, partial [Pricia sp.]|nr:hypothetical protein [Pricia sp.]
MIAEKGISGSPPSVKSMDFKFLREQGIANIQELAGDIWTDYNLHDPGITVLEVLCYALTDLSYRTEQLRNAFRSKVPIADSFKKKYLFEYEELIPSLPVTANDYESFIENNHEAVISAWVTPFPLMEENEIVKGGYEVSVFLQNDPNYKNLNSDVIEIIPEGKKVRIQVILCDGDNQRLQWDQISQIRSCTLAAGVSETFFQFEKHNAQVLLDLDLKFAQKKRYEKTTVKARVTITGVDRPLSKNTSIKRYKDAVLEAFGTKDFIDSLNHGLEKEHRKKGILNKIRHSLLPIRNLCEDFTAFKVVNLQEIKLHIQLTLEPDAPKNGTLLQKLYDHLDAFILSLLRKSKHPEHRDRKQILYTSNIIEELTGIEGVKAVQIENLNLFVDGIPTISLQDEGAFDCLHLQNFARYVPRISREKSVVVIVRNGIRNTLRASEVSAPFTTRSLADFLQGQKTKQKPSVVKEGLDEDFFEEIDSYVSIQEDFPGNYRLTPGSIPEKAKDQVKKQQKRFKSYLLFYERLLVDYLARLSGVTEQLSLKPEEDLTPYNLNDTLADTLPDIKNLELIKDHGNTSAYDPLEFYQRTLIEKDRMLDHLLARFGIRYKNLESRSGAKTEDHVRAKIRLLKDIPKITRGRGLGLPLLPEEPVVWGTGILSGLQARLYRLLGIGDKELLHERLTKTKSNDPKGFYLVEHRLLVPREEYQVYDKKLNQASSLLVDYLNELRDVSEGSFHYS